MMLQGYCSYRSASGKVAKLLLCAVLGLTSSCSSSSESGVVARSEEPLQLQPATYTLVLKTPPNILPTDAALVAQGHIDLGHGATVTQTIEKPGVMTNAGGGGIRLESGANVDDLDLYSTSPVTIEPGAVVQGNIFAPSVDIKKGGRLNGSVNTASANLAPLTVTTIAVNFPAAVGSNVWVSHHEENTLAPGRYATVSVDGGLVLKSGAYFFRSLKATDGSAIQLEQSSGATTVFVEGPVDLHAETDWRKSDDFALVQVSNSPVVLKRPLKGAILAPNAALVLGSEAHGDDHHASSHFWSPWWGSEDHQKQKDDGDKVTFTGAFYAQSILLAPGVHVTYHAPNVLAPVFSPPDEDVSQCSQLIRPDPALTGTAQAIDYQESIARFCTMSGASSCSVDLTSRVNVDYTMVAAELMGGSVDPAHYLSVVRDRTRKKRSAENNSKISDELCKGNDKDGDWVPDSLDKCPNTPELTATDDNGCPTTTLPAAPSADSVKQILSNSGFIINLACADAAALPQIPAGAFYYPSNREVGTYILSGRVTNQPAGCPVWYFFDVQILSGSRARQGFRVAFKDTEASTALVGTPNPVPAGFIQFNALPTDPSTRGTLGNVGGSSVRFRVQAMNGAGVRSGWSDWKITTSADCTALGFNCG